MREIKFRAWDTIQKEIVSYDNLIDLQVHQLFGGGVLGVMQYTGLKDKNGKEIYEGDVVAFSAWQYYKEPKRGVIRFHDGAYVIGEEGELLHTLYPTCEVIGSVYENPELLKIQINEKVTNT